MLCLVIDEQHDSNVCTGQEQIEDAMHNNTSNKTSQGYKSTEDSNSQIELLGAIGILDVGDNAVHVILLCLETTLS
jgi:hypothetical protein